MIFPLCWYHVAKWSFVDKIDTRYKIFYCPFCAYDYTHIRQRHSHLMFTALNNRRSYSASVSVWLPCTWAQRGDYITICRCCLTTFICVWCVLLCTLHCWHYTSHISGMCWLYHCSACSVDNIKKENLHMDKAYGKSIYIAPSSCLIQFYGKSDTFEQNSYYTPQVFKFCMFLIWQIYSISARTLVYHFCCLTLNVVLPSLPSLPQVQHFPQLFPFSIIPADPDCWAEYWLICGYLMCKIYYLYLCMYLFTKYNTMSTAIVHKSLVCVCEMLHA